MKKIEFKVGEEHQKNPVMAIAKILEMAGDKRPLMNFDRCKAGSKTIMVTFKDEDERIVRAMIDLYEAVYVDGEK
jgi:hypothetical protein